MTAGAMLAFAVHACDAPPGGRPLIFPGVGGSAEAVAPGGGRPALALLSTPPELLLAAAPRPGFGLRGGCAALATALSISAKRGALRRRTRRCAVGGSGADGVDGPAMPPEGSLAARPGTEIEVKPSPAQIERQKLWEMPKDMLPLQRTQRTRYLTKHGKQVQIRDLVVVKAPNALKMIRKSRALIAHAAIGQGKLLRMMRHKRWNFGRDPVSEWSRGGRRAFRYRSGMRDLRNEEGYRKEELRPPDRMGKRKRNRTYAKAKREIYMGRGKFKVKK